MILGQETIDRITNSVRAFVDNPESTTDDSALARELATFLQSNSASEDHFFLDVIPSMKLWIDEKAATSPSVKAFTIANRDYESTVVVHKNEIADGMAGPIALRFRQAMDEAYRHFLDGIIDMMRAAFTTICYDGEYLVDTDHPGPGGVSWSNKVSGPLSNATLNEAIVKLARVPDKNGRPVGGKATHVVCAPENRTVLLGILGEYGASGESNPNAGIVKPVITPRLDAGMWFVGDFSRPAKPFIVQVREPLKFVEEDPNSLAGGTTGAPMSENRFMRGILRFGFEARTGFGFGLPQFIVGSTGV